MSPAAARVKVWKDVTGGGERSAAERARQQERRATAGRVSRFAASATMNTSGRAPGIPAHSE
jgi:hypothetical protein